MIKKPKILVCINKLGGSAGVGGAERLVVDDINEMLRRGITVKLLTLRGESVFSLGNECLLNQGDWQTIDFQSFYHISDWIKVYSFVKREKPDLVLTHLWFSNTIMRIVCKIAGMKNVISFEQNIYDTIKTEKMYFADRVLQNYCKKIVAVSSAVKDSLIFHGIKKEKIFVINNAIDIAKYNIESDYRLKKEIGIPENSFVFLTVGRLIPQKGIDILLNAFARLSGDVCLLIIGQGFDEMKLKDLTRELGIENKVHFLGGRKDVPAILAISHVFVLASRHEGLSLALLEAMASKKAIVISDFEGGKEMIADGKEGLVVEKENVESLREALNKLATDSTLRLKLASGAYEKVQEFSIQNHVDKILSL